MADKVRKLNEIDKEFLKSKTPYALPDNPSNKGFSASQIKAKMYEGHLVVYEWLKQLQAETNTAFDLNDAAIAIINSAIDTINATKATKTELATLESNIEDGTITAY
ncbi:MAG TPA: hypothetical protein PLR16_07145, partial [Bacilli bacterium]|nr:hypothetical protein [Bacilli bacterium]